MKELRHKYIFDAILSVLLIVEMFFELTGDMLHEIIGCLFFATIVLHLILSRRWMTVTAKQLSSGKGLKLANKLRLFLAVGLAVSFIALASSSIAISLQLINITGVNLAGSARETWIIVHTVSSYALCAFTIAHVLVHWSSILPVFKIPYNPARRQAINTGASAIVAVSAVALGVAGGQSVEEILDPRIPQQQNGSTPTAEATPAEPTTPVSPSAPVPQEPMDESALSGKKGKKNRLPEGNAASTPSQPAPNTVTPESPNASQQDNATTVEGYCTLCHLHCPLSAPQCNKPYQAGSI